jgi:hypothetical protein
MRSKRSHNGPFIKPVQPIFPFHMIAWVQGARPAIRTWWALVLLLDVWGMSAWSADKVTGTMLVKDALTGLNQSVAIQAKLIRKGLLGDVGLGGEPLELAQNGEVVAKAMTGGDGRAVLHFTPKTRGMATLTVRVGDSPRVDRAEATSNVAVWERRTPILAVEVAALMEAATASSPVPALPLGEKTERIPLPDAADELSKLTKFYYNVIYIAIAEGDRSGGFATNGQIRTWLKTHKFPPGHILVLSGAAGALGVQLDELHAAGWKTLKAGIGRSNAFAETFLERRHEALIVPEPAKGEVPRKAKVAKEWKEVRKKL